MATFLPTPLPSPLSRPLARRLGLVALSAALLGGCTGDFRGLDFDLRGGAGAFTTAPAAAGARTEPRPSPDARGIISYPNYQVAVARRGDTLATLAERVGLPAAELARYNGLSADAPLRRGEVIALPRRVAEPPAGAGRPSGGTIDITTLAGNAIDRASPGTAATPAQPAAAGQEPSRHRVKRGETAYSIARLYGVSVKALAEWNGLDANLTVREGQVLLIPPVVERAAPPADTPPGKPSPLPPPPSAAEPLPDEQVKPAAQVPTPPSPELGKERTSASASKLRMPVEGKIIRPFVKGKRDGIDIAAPAGTPVVAAADGTVAAITRNTDGVPILVIRHSGNLLTVYANIDDLAVKKGDRVKRGQKIAVVRAGNPSFLHFQVREGTTAVDPELYIN